MTAPVLLHGPLAAHRRGRILQEALSAEEAATLPEGRAVVLAFADGFQDAEEGEQSRLVEWTRMPGHLLLLVPPFAVGACTRPVTWRAERMERAPAGGEGLAKVLASEVAYRLDGKLQTPAVPGATWSDLSVCIGTYRLHPAAGLFAVTCLPLWSLAVLDAPEALASWFASLSALSGESQPTAQRVESALQPDHYGLLVFLLSRSFDDEEQAIAALRSSSVFRFSPERGRSLLQELRDRGLVAGVLPTAEATEHVMQSPYAPYISALREVSIP
ncbi:hypothetical protein [Bradyrhizobium sp. SZCCHNR1015]|uniref:hypothetical protein n=1 Tax=Bradyrhizobium sp. SZCCHNR1015 TaxID=3057338 RepID=UPI002916EC52|nr:hypothetical protein [Bradyrhizobium sp. SZCCHNR1015]